MKVRSKSLRDDDDDDDDDEDDEDEDDADPKYIQKVEQYDRSVFQWITYRVYLSYVG